MGLSLYKWFCLSVEHEAKLSPQLPVASHDYGVEFHQEFNGHGLRYVTHVLLSLNFSPSQGWHILRIKFKKSSPVDKIGFNWL